tara:strand:+ start:6763 stop:7887 length:1125 start_codon:yes stop_codon:yes gene_type:complete
MKITLKRTPDQVELVKAMASRNRNVAYEAQVALAEFIGPVLAEVLNQAPTLSNLFQSLQFDADDNPSIPLDLYYNISDEDYVNVWSQSHAGGLATNQVLPTASELKLATYSLDSAISFDRRYAAKSRLDVVSKTFSRVAQEILLKQERTSATLILSALASATTNGQSHAVESTTLGRIVLDDLNKLLTMAKRINTSWVGGTPTERTKGITDLICSPEVVQDLRAMAYNPINVIDSDGSALVGNQEGFAGPESMRDELWRNAGIPTFYGLGIMEINELGVGQKFTTIYDTVASASSVSPQSDFDAADDLVLGIDRTRDSMVRAVAVDAESGSEFTLMADDQYSIRQNKIGYFGSVDEGRVVLDNRAIVGIQVNAA